MTKGQAYEKYNLSLKDVNFDPDEVADEKFIDGCLALNRLQCRVMTGEVSTAKAAMVERYGEEQAEHMLKLGFLSALSELIRQDQYPFWLGIAVAELFDNGCTVQAVMNAMDKVGDYIKFTEREEEKNNENNDK